jgi:predicted secreted protein/putative hemolysin
MQSDVPGKRIVLALGLVTVLAIGLLAPGCAQQPAGTAAAPTATAIRAAAPAAAASPAAGIPNPASAYCGEAGGTLEIRKDASGGEYGMCNFPNGSSCEEWALYHGEGCRPGIATTAAATAAAAKQMVTFTQADNNSTVQVAQAAKFAVRLAENPTTGYSWNMTPGRGIALVSTDYQENSHPAGMVGVGGNRTWILQADETGIQTIRGIYKQPWMATTGNETTYSLTVNVTKA